MKQPINNPSVHSSVGRVHHLKMLPATYSIKSLPVFIPWLKCPNIQPNKEKIKRWELRDPEFESYIPVCFLFLFFWLMIGKQKNIQANLACVQIHSLTEGMPNPR